MPIPVLPEVDPNATVAELIDVVAVLKRTIEYHLTSGLDTTNAREFGGWYIGPDALSSKNGTVGLSSAITGANDIRIWAGSATPGSAPFQVYENGYMSATNGYFTGSISASTVSASSISGGSITGASITGASITGASITGGSITGGSIYGGLIQGALFQTSSSYPLTTISGSQIYAYRDSSNFILIDPSFAYPTLMFSDDGLYGSFFQSSLGFELLSNTDVRFRTTGVGSDIHIVPDDGYINIPGWGRLYSNADGESLATALSSVTAVFA